jgi:hypothetical protein
MTRTFDDTALRRPTASLLVYRRATNTPARMEYADFGLLLLVGEGRVARRVRVEVDGHLCGQPRAQRYVGGYVSAEPAGTRR